MKVKILLDDELPKVSPLSVEKVVRDWCVAQNCNNTAHPIRCSLKTFNLEFV